MADIFISYKREDRKKVELIAHQLNGLGLSVWFDSAIAPGAQFSDAIERQLETSKAVLVCWTEAATKSDFVLDEARRALNTKKLLPLMLETCRVPNELSGLEAVDLRGWRGDSNSELLTLAAKRIASRIHAAVDDSVAIVERATDDGAWWRATNSSSADEKWHLLSAFKPLDGSPPTFYWPFNGNEAEFARFFQRQLYLTRAGAAKITFFGDDEAVTEEFVASDHSDASLAPRTVPDGWLSGAASIRFEIRAPQSTDPIVLWCARGGTQAFQEAGACLKLHYPDYMRVQLVNLMAKTHRCAAAAADLDDALGRVVTAMGFGIATIEARAGSANDNRAEEFALAGDDAPPIEDEEALDVEFSELPNDEEA